MWSKNDCSNEEFWLGNVTTCKIHAVNKMFLKFIKWWKMRNKEFYQRGQFDLMIFYIHIQNMLKSPLSPNGIKKLCTNVHII